MCPTSRLLPTNTALFDISSVNEYRKRKQKTSFAEGTNDTRLHQE